MRKFMRAWYEFMNLQLNHYTRKQPALKTRRYAHVQIQKEFKKSDETRKNQRLSLVTHRKNILVQRLAANKRLLQQRDSNKLPAQTVKEIEQQSAAINKNLEAVESELKEYDKQLVQINKKLEQTESQYIVVEGITKQCIRNKIAYIMHMTTHSFTLHPVTQKAVQNIHYLLQRGLPLPKYTLYEIMPELFENEINELSESAKKLIQQKKLVFEKGPKSLLSFYQKQVHDPSDPLLSLLKEEKDLWHNINRKALQLIMPSYDLRNRIREGKTRFRSFKHFYYECIDIDEPTRFTSEEWALKQTILEIEKMKQDFNKYLVNQRKAINKILYEVRIPIYAKNNPVLFEFFKNRVQSIVSNVTEITQAVDLLPQSTEDVDLFERKLRQALEKQLPPEFNIDRYDPLAPQKNFSYERFLKIATKVMHQVPHADQKLDAPAEQFKKLSVEDKIRLMEQTNIPLPQVGNRITMRQITRVLHLNNQDPKTYNLEYFSKWFGIDPKKLQNVFNYVSFPRVAEDGTKKIMKFI